MTQHDKLTMHLAFDIVIEIEMLLSLINKEDLAVKLKMQDENTRVLGVFLAMRQNEEIGGGGQVRLDSSSTSSSSSSNANYNAASSS